jgi:hypothetical protein
MTTLPDLRWIKLHTAYHHHFLPGNRYVHPNDPDIRVRHASAHKTGEVTDGHTHANPMYPLRGTSPGRQAQAKQDEAYRIVRELAKSGSLAAREWVRKYEPTTQPEAYNPDDPALLADLTDEEAEQFMRDVTE